jgi:C4-dicarboxylate-specific signal transduction histidine kinase
LGIDFIVCFTCVVLWVGVNTWVLVVQQIVNTDRAELKDFLNEVDKLHKTDEAVPAKIANNPALAKALTDPNLTPTQKQQLAKELVSGAGWQRLSCLIF